MNEDGDSKLCNIADPAYDLTRSTWLPLTLQLYIQLLFLVSFLRFMVSIVVILVAALC